MAQQKDTKEQQELLQRIKIIAVEAMFADDDLLDELVLKGGNAMALVHRISARASVDLDFSLQQDFGENIDLVSSRIEKTLSLTFRENGFESFDFKMIEKPRAITEDMKDFWGGYGVEFKLATKEIYAEFSSDISTLRRRAINLGQGPKFLIDISRFEYTEDKQAVDFDGYVIYVYSPIMIVCEKLRAICQQMPEYGPIIKRDRAGSARPKDFLDIYVLMEKLKLDLLNEKGEKILTSMFDIKRVPLAFLGRVANSYDFHEAGFASVQATVATDFELKDFSFYFDYTTKLIDELKPFWDK